MMSLAERGCSRNFRLFCPLWPVERRRYGFMTGARPGKSLHPLSRGSGDYRTLDGHAFPWVLPAGRSLPAHEKRLRAGMSSANVFTRLQKGRLRSGDKRAATEKIAKREGGGLGDANARA